MDKRIKTDHIHVMPRLEWDDKYSLGIDKFDNQHKELFEYINELRDIMMGNRSEDMIEHTFKSILNFTMTHFLEEEIFLFKNEYPDYENHKREHDNFMNEVKGLYVQSKADKSNSKIISAEITGVLTEWIQVHIVKTDKDYVDYFRSKNIEFP